MSQSKILPPTPTRHLARLTFVAFLFTFIASRTLVILIMGRRMPDLFLHLGGTHVHHLNYGIFLLSGVGAYLLLRRPVGKALSTTAMVRQNSGLQRRVSGWMETTGQDRRR